MKKLLVTLTAVAFLSGIALAESQEQEVELKPKWNLMGTSFEITDMTRFDKPQILILWTWDTDNETWQFYTGDSAIEDLVRSYGYNTTIDKIPAFKGFWVRVTEPVEVSLPAGTLEQPPQPPVEENNPPVLTLDNQTVVLTEGDTAEVGVTATDPDNDTVTVAVSSSNETVATASYTDGKIIIEAQSAGSAVITVTATDSYGGVAEKTISVTVEPPQVDYSGYLWVYASPDADVVYWDKDQSLSATNGDTLTAVITFEKPTLSQYAGKEFPFALLITDSTDTQYFLEKSATQVTGTINICFNNGSATVLSQADYTNCEVAIKIDQNLPAGDYKIVRVENGQIVGEVATYHKE